MSVMAAGSLYVFIQLVTLTCALHVTPTRLPDAGLHSVGLAWSEWSRSERSRSEGAGVSGAGVSGTGVSGAGVREQE